MILPFPKKERLVDENRLSLVDPSTSVHTIEEIKNAKAVASVVEKLYGVKQSTIEVLRENQIFNQGAKGRS